jgi:hypothetical protein
MEFPVFVKYSNNKHFFKITALDTFLELTVYAKAYSVFAFQAKTFVDRNLIADLIELKTGIEISSEEEYEKQLNLLIDNGAKKLS